MPMQLEINPMQRAPDRMGALQRAAFVGRVWGLSSVGPGRMARVSSGIRWRPYGPGHQRDVTEMPLT